MNKKKMKLYRDKLNELKEKIYQRSIKGDRENITGTELSYLDNHPADTSHEDWEKIKDGALKSEDEKKLEEIEKALARLEENSYGICEGCKESIEEKRLEVIPYTRYCSSCAKYLDRQRDKKERIRPIKEKESFLASDKERNIWEQMESYGSSGYIIEGDGKKRDSLNPEDGRESGIVEEVEKEKEKEKDEEY